MCPRNPPESLLDIDNRLMIDLSEVDDKDEKEGYEETGRTI